MDRECNFCTYVAIKTKADREGKTITIELAPTKYFPDGINVLVDNKFVAWFAELTTNCVC